ncbi:DNase I-like protein [Hypoxylon sp. NC1633]|nr:DNase I-like protein [Hypoxylon sp. NC1633]
MKTIGSFAAILVAATSAAAQSIAQINGDRFLSPFNGQTVANVTGVVTAKGPDGIWLRSVKPGRDKRVSDGLYLYGSALASNASISVGDVIVVGGKVSEYRSSKDYLYMTELGSPRVTAVLERGRAVKPRVIGRDTPSPPTRQYTALDNGDVFGVPNNQSLVSAANPRLEPEKYGLDFWESLVGELVTIESPRAIAKPNQYGDTWVVGDWAATGANARTGLTMSDRDANPEAIIIGTPLDGSDNPTDTRLGDRLSTITGVVYQAFGFYRVLPLTRVTVTSSLSPAVPPPTALTSSAAASGGGASCGGVTVGSYNVENFYAGDAAHVQAVARHIVQYMRTPDLVAVQEIQDNDGETDDGVVDADATLDALVGAILSLSSANGTSNSTGSRSSGGGGGARYPYTNSSTAGVLYNYTYISPPNDVSGGAPGGNIRVAYLYRADVLRLRNANKGSAELANEVLPGPELKYNPGYVDPANAAWEDSRRPLAAVWELVSGNGTRNGNGTGKPLFTINVHWTSKGGSSSLHGDARPPVNGGVEGRLAQAEVTASFIADILAEDPSAYVLTAGDYNEFAFARPVEDFASRSGLVDLDAAAGIPSAERYTYLFDMNSQELDHVFVSPGLAAATLGFEHLHVNTWVSYDDATSDHDPSVGKFDLC